MKPDNYVWLLLLALSSLVSFLSTLASASVLTTPKDHHFLRLFHESIVRQQSVYPSFYVSLATATRLREAQHTALAPLVLVVLSILFLVYGLKLVRLQDAEIAAYAEQKGKTPGTLGLADWLRIFKFSVAMSAIGLTLAIIVASGPWALRPSAH